MLYRECFTHLNYSKKKTKQNNNNQQQTCQNLLIADVTVKCVDVHVLNVCMYMCMFYFSFPPFLLFLVTQTVQDCHTESLMTPYLTLFQVRLILELCHLLHTVKDFNFCCIFSNYRDSNHPVIFWDQYILQVCTNFHMSLSMIY